MGPPSAGAVPETAAQVRWVTRKSCGGASRLALEVLMARVNVLKAMHSCSKLPAVSKARPAAAAAAAATATCCPPACLLALQAVLVPSEQLPDDAVTIRGYDFNQGCDLDALLGSMFRTGLQATALGQAMEEVNRMVGG